MLESPHPEHIERALFEADHVACAFAEIDSAARSGEPFDVLHDHNSATTLAMAARQPLPVVHTVHGPFDEDTSEFYGHNGARGSLVCISRSQASQAPEGANVADVVYNPIDVDAWPVGYKKQDYLLWLGRFVPEKGPQRAIQVARAARRPESTRPQVAPGPRGVA